MRNTRFNKWRSCFAFNFKSLNKKLDMVNSQKLPSTQFMFLRKTLSSKSVKQLNSA